MLPGRSIVGIILVQWIFRRGKSWRKLGPQHLKIRGTGEGREGKGEGAAELCCGGADLFGHLDFCLLRFWASGLLEC